MANRPITNNPKADLPTSWVAGQTVAPNGGDVGLSEQHGYNYLNGKVNEALECVGALNAGFDGVAPLEGGKVPADNLPLTQLPTVIAARDDSDVYTATVPGITELTRGLMITIIPARANTTDAPYLNINGLGEYRIVRPYSIGGMTTGLPANTLRANQPLTLRFATTSWVTVGIERTYASDLQGTVPVSAGGTGRTSFELYRLLYPSAATTLAQVPLPTVSGSVLRQTTSGAPYWTSLADLAELLLGTSQFPQIRTGTYTGTGAATASLTFDIVPKLLIVAESWSMVLYNSMDHSMFWIDGAERVYPYSVSTSIATVQTSNNGKTISWTRTYSSDSTPLGYLNKSGTAYVYFAIGL